jgi:hemerythrin-like domain-containing protein
MTELTAAIDDEDEDIVSESLAFLRGPYRRHVKDEELSIFPRLGPEHTEAVAKLVSEHREHEALIDQLRSAWHLGNISTARELVRQLKRALNRHSQLEERKLWPSVAALSAGERLAARAEMRERRQKNGDRGGRRHRERRRYSTR